MQQRRALPPLAMVNVDFASPSLVLGVTLIGCGIALLQVRNMQREVSRDADIVVAAMISIVGSTLIFQGWRLDPLLLLCQALTTSVAFWYGLEAFKLRAEVVADEERQDMPNGLPPLDSSSAARGGPEADFPAATRPGFLPPGAERPLPPWAQQQQQQPMGMGAGSSSSRWGLPPPEQVGYGSFVQGSSMAPESMYAGYEQQQQQQPYGGGYVGGPMDPAAAGGLYEGVQQQQGFAPLPPQQQDWAQMPGAAMPPQQQPQQLQQGWDVLGQPVQQQQQQLLPYPPGVDPAAFPYAAGIGQQLAPDGSPPYDGSSGAGVPGAGAQPQPQQQQQQQQQQQRGVRKAGYEQVDDWE
jgi:hypothetical protein